MTFIVDGTSGLTFPNNTTQGSGGKVIQVVQSVHTSAISTTSTSFVTTGFSASITPLFSTSKILATVSCGNAYQANTASAGFLTLYRGSTNLADGTYGFAVVYNSAGQSLIGQSFTYLDSPATTSSTTYTIYYKTTGGGTMWLNNTSGLATITLTEIAA